MASVGASTNDVSGIKRKDAAWEWGECKNPLVKNNITCKLCGKEMSGGISRLKEHLTHIKGNVLSCDKVPNDKKKKCEELIVQKRQKKYSRQRIDYMMENEASLLSGDIEHVVEDEDPFSGKSSGSGSATSKNKVKRTSDVRGPLDTMLKPDFGKMKQKTLDKNNPIKEELKMKAWNSLSKWTLEAGIPFNVVRCPSFQQAMHDVGEYGRGMPVPSYHQMRTNLFSNRLQETKQFIESFREHWVATGCSIMSDFWTDGKGRSLINFLVNCPKGTVFLKSIDASEHIKNANLIVKLVNEVILDVGADNIVQFVTDNGSNFKAAGRILEEMHPKMFWTPCAAHCVNLMLQELGDKIPKIKSVVAQGKAVVTYIYNHGRVLSMMRELTGGKELHRSCVTRFATNFYTLKTIYENRHHLQVLFVSEKWTKSEFAKKTDGKRVMMIVSKNDFWENVQFTCQVLAPLVDVLRLVDTEEKPSMGYLYEAMDRAKEQIEKNIGSTNRVYIKISEIVDKRWEDQLHHPLHAAVFYLNPGFFYKIPKREMDTGRYREVKFGLYKAINKLVPEEVEHDQIKLDLRKYAEAAGLLGSQSAVRQRDKIQPSEWWYVNGFDVPCLQTFAIRVLSLTCSASPCERNWSAFDHIHSKKRNRFLQSKLNDIVFIQYNKKLERRYVEKFRYNVVDEEPIFLKEVEENDEWVIPTDEALQDFVREGDDLTWSQVRDAREPTDVGPRTRRATQELQSDTHPSFRLVDEDDETEDQVGIDADDMANEEEGGIGNDDNEGVDFF